MRTLRILADLAGTLLYGILLPILYPILASVGLLARIRSSARQGIALPLPPSLPTQVAFRPPVSVVIPNWNGRDLLEKYLPSVVSACNFELGDEILVVDNASQDGSAQFLAQHFPEVRTLPLVENLGFGGGSNAGVEGAINDYVVLLNSDMRVEPDFLAPLLAPFADSSVFAVAAQILFSDPHKRREESGLTYASWQSGQIELGHDLRADVPKTYPCFYPGGGSSAFDRAKLRLIGGFDHLFRPFYFEDTDLGFEAWKRGWKVLYAPASVVYHEHRGTIGKRFSSHFVDRVVAKNRILFHWKHVVHPWDLACYCGKVLWDCLRSAVRGAEDSRASGSAVWAALLQFPELLGRRWASARRAVQSERAALSLHRPDIFHDRLVHAYDAGARPRVLFLSPYPIYPPHHGGAVLMSQTLRHLVHHCDVHLIVLLEEESERDAHLAEDGRFASMHLLVRPPAGKENRFGTSPKAVREFASSQLRTLIERVLFEHAVDVLQVEYTNLAQYTKPYRSVLTALFEHDVYFQSVARRIRRGGDGLHSSSLLEYLRALRFEVKALQMIDYVQVCTEDNAAYLESFSPSLREKMDHALRAGIDVESYPCQQSERDPETLLFVGNFRHQPNRQGLQWLIERVMPAVLLARPAARLRVVGANIHLLGLDPSRLAWLDLLGAVDDVRPHLRSCAAFVCPVLTGSGVRVKLLEAFASGIPVVTTVIGAEGLLYAQNPICAVADTPEEFVKATLRVLSHPEVAARMALDARQLVERDWDVATNTRRLVARYRELLAAKSRKRVAQGEGEPDPVREAAV